jgi:3-oxoacyl-[acyl-carrier protein] reductase
MLKDKKAIITGGTRGIGKAIAKKFAESGCSIALFGTNATVGKEAVEEIAASCNHPNFKISFYQVNVGNTVEVEAAIKQVMEEFGSVDILVNNAGITRDNLLMKMGEEDWDQVIDTNLKSVYNTSKALIRTMMKARFGKIINITSVVGLIGNPGQTNYAASKAGIIGFTKALAKEVASRNISVNCIAPGFIQTAMTDVLTDEQKKSLLGQIPMNRLGQPEEIANAALFLASDASNYITGQVITVDGGMVM